MYKTLTGLEINLVVFCLMDFPYFEIKVIKDRYLYQALQEHVNAEQCS